MKIEKLLLLFLPLVILVMLSFSLKNLSNKKSTEINFKEKYPYIDYPIGCKGASEEEYSKRKEHSSGYFEPEVYMKSYENKWDKNTDSQQFNMLLSPEETYDWPQKYPKELNGQYSKAYTIPSEAFLKNYVERVDVGPKGIELNGSGYFFPETGPVITLSSRYLYKELAAKEEGECFDNKKRILNINLEESVYAGTVSKTSNDLKFSVLTPQYCTAFSFLDTAGDLFLICLSEKISKKEIKVLLLGYSKVSVQDQDSGEFSDVITPVLNKIVTDLYSEDNFFYYNSNFATMIRNSKGYYYLFTGKKVFEIKPDDSGYLKMSDVRSVFGDRGFNVLYPNNYSSENYNLPFVFMSGLSSDDKVGSVFDLSKGRFLEVEYESCVLKAPEEFYNETIDPFAAGPYKSLNYKAVSPTHVQVEQSSQNAGCVTNEGLIDVYITGESVKCGIKVLGDVSC